MGFHLQLYPPKLSAWVTVLLALFLPATLVVYVLNDLIWLIVVPIGIMALARRGRGRRVGNTDASTERRASDEEVLADETADEARSTREAKPSSERNGHAAD